MRTTFAHAPSPLAVSVVRERTVKEVQAAIRNSEYDGCGGIDLHLSCLDKSLWNVDAFKSIISCTDKPLLALNYASNYDYSPMEMDEETRIDLLVKAAEAGASAIDMQGYSFDLKSKGKYCGDMNAFSFAKKNPKEVVTDAAIIAKQCELIEKMHAMGTEVLLSSHTGVPMTAEELCELALFLEKRNPDVLKIVTPCENEEQLAESFRAIIMLKKEVKTQVSYHCNGKAGRLSRIVNPLLGSHLAFCCDRFSVSASTEQLDLKTATDVLCAVKKML